MTIATSDIRSPLRTLLLRYRASDTADMAQRDKILKFLEKNPNCFERTHMGGHITGSAWVLDKTKTKVLLTFHKKLNKWLQLGGHADGDPDTPAVALREAEEESGLSGLIPLSPDIFDLDVHPIPERPGEPAHFHYDIRFLLQTTGNEIFSVGHESIELAWVPLDKLASYSNEPSLLRMAAKSKIKGI